MKKSFNLFLLLLVSTFANAQFQGSVGPMIGGNFGLQYTKKPNLESDNLSAIGGLNYGAMAFLVWHKKGGYRSDGVGYGFRPTLQITEKGSIQKDNFTVGGIKSVRSRLTYIDFALPIVMKKEEYGNDKNSGTKFIGIGPTLSGLLSNKVTTASTQPNTPDIHSSLSVGSENTDDIKPFEVGIKAILGAKFGHFCASIELDIGLNNSPQPDTYISNRQIALNLAWLFHPKR